ncbi:MAG: sensor histidine kinase [Limisphaerales bacterium]
MHSGASSTRCFVITAVAITVALFIRHALDPLLQENAPFIPFYAAILTAAWYGGWQFGLWAMLAGAGLSIWLFIEPRHEFALVHRSDLAAVVLFVVVSGVGVLLIEQTRRSERKARKAEEALRERQRELTAAQEQLQRHAEELEKNVAERTHALTSSLGFMQEFLYSIAHDLRAPLRSMNGFVEALTEDYASHLDETARDYGARIRASCERMDRMIHDLLEYGRLSHTRMEMEEVGVESVLREVLLELGDDIARRGARIEMAAMPRPVKGNATALRQIFRNLVSNAIKFVGANRTPEVRVWAEEENGKILIYIQDNGIGIPPQYVDRIFKPFQRLHTQDQFEGVGMGLSISRLTAETIGGRLYLKSSSAEGSCFCLEMQRAG